MKDSTQLTAIVEQQRGRKHVMEAAAVVDERGIRRAKFPAAIEKLLSKPFESLVKRSGVNAAHFLKQRIEKSWWRCGVRLCRRGGPGGRIAQACGAPREVMCCGAGRF